MPYIHLCETPDCKCESDLLRGLQPGKGVMVPPVPDWLYQAFEEDFMGFKRPKIDTTPKPMENAWADPADKADFPNLFGFLTETKYDDGQPRMTGSISIFTQLGVLKASISDKDNKRVAYVEACTLHELIELVERAICDDNTVWKAQQPYRQPTF